MPVGNTGLELYRYDLGRGNFFQARPFRDVLQYAEKNGKLDDLVASCRPDLQTDRLEVVLVPKFDGTLRNGAHLHPADALQWCSLGAELRPYFELVCGPYDDVSYAGRPRRSQRDVARTGMLRDPYGYRDFSRATADRIRAGYDFVAVRDIRKFYPSVNPEHIVRLAELQIPPKLVDRVAHFVEAFGIGLPQGYTTSDMIARLLLTSGDLVINRSGFHILHYSDDYRGFGRTSYEAGSALALIDEIYESAGFSANPHKWGVRGPSQSKYLPWLGDMADVHLDRYLLDPERKVPDSTAFLQYAAQPRNVEVICTTLDIPGLYEDLIVSGEPKQSEHLERVVIRSMGQADPSRLAEDAQAILNERPESAAIIFAALLPDDAVDVAAQTLISADLSQPCDRHRAKCALSALAPRGLTSALARAPHVRYADQLPADVEAELLRSLDGKAEREDYAALATRAHTNAWPDLEAARVGIGAQMAPSDWRPLRSKWKNANKGRRIALEHAGSRSS